MNTREIEDRVRDVAWPAPSPSLRGRVIAEARDRAARLPAIRRVNWTPGTEPDAPPKRAWRTVPVLVVIVALIVVGACTGFDLWTGRSLNAEIARLEVKYGSLDQATLLGPAVPDADNRAYVIRAAAALAVPLAGVKYHYISFPVSSPVPADLRAFAEANRPAIRAAWDVRARRRSNWEVDYRSLSNGPPLQSMRILSDAIHIATLLDIEEGRPADAAHMIVSGLGISASLRQEPDGRISRIFDPSRHLEAIRQLLNTSAPSATALQELAWWLAENRTPDSTRRSMLVAMKRTNALFMRMEHGEIDPDVVHYIYPMTWPDWPSMFVRPAAMIGRPLVRTARLRYLRHMDRLLDVETGPRPRPVVPEAKAPRRWALVDRLVDKFTAGTWGESDNGDDVASELGATELAVALRRYKLDHGAYPADLSEVVPTYLDRLPIDPYTGKPAVYARQGEGFTLHARSSNPYAVRWRALEWRVEK